MKRIYKYFIGAAIVAVLGYGGAKLLSGPQSWYNVVDFGIKNDSSADIAASLQALINFVPSGSVIYFPVGKYRQDGGDTVGNKQIKFLGPMSAMRNDGVSWSGTQNCTIFHGNASDSAFRIEGAGTSFENISISYAGTGTSTGWGIYYHNGYYARMNHTLVYNFGTLLEMKNAAEYVVDDCFFIYAHNASGVIISDSLNPDNGDGVFNNCYFTNYGATTIQNAFRWNSGGGLRMTNSKFNGGFKNCFYAPFIGSIDGQIVNCAFENYDSSAIKFLLPAAGTINNLVISQNYMNGLGAGGHISLTGIAAGSLIQAVNISGNQFYGHGIDTAIYVNGPKFIYIGANSYAKVGKSIAGTINNVSTNSLWVNFPDGIQALTESSNAVVMDLGFGSTGSFVITGNDTLKLFSAFNSQTNAPIANSGFAQGAPFRIKVTQDATGGHNLITQGFGLNYSGGTTGNAVIGLDTRANAVTIVEGYVNNNGAPTITKTSRYMESKAIPFIGANNAMSEDITNLNYDYSNLMLTGARMKLLPLTKLTAADGQLQYDGTHLFFDVGTTHYQIDQQTAGSITLTTTGTSGAATLVGSTLNIPVYGGGGGTPGGSDTYVQFNDGGAFGGVSNYTFDKSTNILNVNKTIGATATDGFQLFSSGAATLGNQQYSPSIDLKGFGWATTPSTSQSVNFKIYNVPVQGAANPTGTLFIQGQVNGGTNTTLLTISTAGIITNGGAQTNSAVFNIAGVSNFTSDLWVSSTGSTSGLRISNSGGNNYIDAKGSGEGFNFRTNTNGINAMHLDGGNGGAATFGVLTNQGFAQVEAVKTSGAQFSAVYDGTHHTEFTTNSSGNLAIVPSGGTTTITGNLTLGTAGNALNITEGTNGRVGQTTLVSGTKAITISGLTTSSRAFITLVSPSGASLTTACQAVCTANTLTIQADVSAGTINTADASVYNYFVIN